MQATIQENTLQKIAKNCRLIDQEAELLAKYLKRVKVNRLIIRDTLCEENQPSKHAYLLLQGTVNVMASLSNGEKLMLCQTGKNELLNLQIILNNWINKFTLVVSSSFIKYITLQERQINLLTANIKEQLRQSTIRRQKSITKKNKQILDHARKKAMQQNIDKLIFPEINMNNKRKSIVKLSQDVMLESSNIQQVMPIFSKQLNKRKSSSLKSIQRRFHEPQTFQEKMMQDVNENLINKFHKNKDKVFEKQMQRLKSERSISLNDKQVKQVDYTRNEKIFKQQLKNIVKRKLLFERKHFKILNNFKNELKEHDYEGPKKYEGQYENPIDNYFNM